MEGNKAVHGRVVRECAPDAGRRRCLSAGIAALATGLQAGGCATTPDPREVRAHIDSMLKEDGSETRGSRSVEGDQMLVAGDVDSLQPLLAAWRNEWAQMPRQPVLRTLRPEELRLRTELVARLGDRPNRYLAGGAHLAVGSVATDKRDDAIDWLTELEPVQVLAVTPWVLVGRMVPGQPFATLGAGSPSHVLAATTAQLLRSEAGVRHFDGLPAAVAAVRTGMAGGLMAPLSMLQPWLRAEGLPTVAISGEARHPALPSVPSFAEFLPEAPPVLRFEHTHAVWAAAGTAEAGRSLRPRDTRGLDSALRALGARLPVDEARARDLLREEFAAWQMAAATLDRPLPGGSRRTQPRGRSVDAVFAPSSRT